jgi:hypothetical protein
MRNLLCVIGRDEWRIKYDNEGRPFEICGRPRCYRLRDHDAPSEEPRTGTDRGLPPPPLEPPNLGSGELSTPLGAMCVFLAGRLSASTFDTGSAVAAVSKELRGTTDLVLADTTIDIAPLDELRARRDARRAQWPVG